MKTKRKILFKAVRRDTREWISGSLIISVVSGEEYYHIQEEGTVGSRYCYPVDPETICQYTGLLDKNEIEIFEGDILTSNDYPYQDEGERNYDAIVEWVFASFQTILTCVNPKKNGISEGMNSHIEDGSHFEIIGNIYDGR